MKRFARPLAALLAFALIAYPAIATVAAPTYKPFIAGSLTTTVDSQQLYIANCSSVSFVLTGNAASFSVTFKTSTAADPSVTASYVTTTTIGTAGVATANGTYSGPIGGFGLQWAKLTVTAIGSGTLTYYATCTSAAPATVAVTGAPTPQPLQTGPNGQIVVEQPTAARLNVTAVFASAQPVTQSGAWTIANTAFGITGAIPTGANVIGAVTQSGAWTVAQGTAAASSASWPFFLFGLSGTNQADVDSSHRLLTIASQSGAPWSMNVANTPAPVPWPTPTAGAAAPANAPPVVAYEACQFGSNQSVTAGNAIAVQCDNQGFIKTVACGLATVPGCAQAGTFNSGFGNTNGATLSIAQIYAQQAGGSSTKPLQMDNYAAGPLWTTEGGSTTSAAVTAGKNSVTVIKGTVGRLVNILVTTTGTAALNCFDNASAASGTQIGAVPASAGVGTLWPSNMPAVNGITCSASTNNPAVTISYY